MIFRLFVFVSNVYGLRTNSGQAWTDVSQIQMWSNFTFSVANFVPENFVIVISNYYE